MSFDSAGYELKFVQKRPCKDGSDHKFTLIYKFYSTKTKLIYILSADYHTHDVFGIKFYCKKDKTSDFKYSKIVNRGDVGNILVTCTKIIPILLEQYPTASFGFAASRSVDNKNKLVEQYQMNQRFKTYTKVAARKIGSMTFTHFEYPQISSYLLVNNNHGNVSAVERLMVNMFVKTYETLLDV